MMASHGRGQRLGFRFDRLVGARGQGALALAGALGLGLMGGRADACHIRHQVRTTSDTTPGGPAAETLNPTNLVPSAPMLTPATAPTITATVSTAPVPPMAPPAALNPSPATNPPAADQIMPASPAVSTYSGGTAPTCSCTCPPVSPPPMPACPPATPSGPSSLQPSLGTGATPNTPEPSTIVSALAMLTAAVVVRRRRAIG